MSDVYQIPILKRCIFVPAELFPWEEKSKYKGVGAFHFYCEDAYLNGLWSNLSRNPLPAPIKRAGFCLTPDFSTYTDWPFVVNLWNVYRARTLGALWQSMGIQVIPSLAWGDKSQFDYLFEGLPIGGTFAISTGQAAKEPDVFKEFYLEMLERCKPDTMLVYGRGLKGWIEKQNCKVIRYDSRLTQIYKQRKAI